MVGATPSETRANDKTHNKGKQCARERATGGNRRCRRGGEYVERNVLNKRRGGEMRVRFPCEPLDRVSALCHDFRVAYIFCYISSVILSSQQSLCRNCRLAHIRIPFISAECVSKTSAKIVSLEQERNFDLSNWKIQYIGNWYGSESFRDAAERGNLIIFSQTIKQKARLWTWIKLIGIIETLR